MSFEMRQNPQQKAIVVARGPSGARPGVLRGRWGVVAAGGTRRRHQLGGQGGDVIGLLWVVKSKNLTRPGPEGTGGFTRLTPHAADPPFLRLLHPEEGREERRDERTEAPGK